jgi:beta-glucanase (GH16 family)
VGWSWGRTADHTGAYAGDGNVQVRGGRLHLVQRREAVGGRRYSAGLVETLAPLGSSGYVEVRARTVAGQGQRSGLALLPVAGDGEGTSFSAWALGVLGRDPRTVHMSAHGPDASGRPRASTTAWSAGRDTSAGFHTYGLEWSPRTVAWFVDGVERRRTARLTPGGPVRLSLGVDVGGDPWWGEPDAATPFPTEYVVDVVRVYATRPGGHAAKFSP